MTAPELNERWARSLVDELALGGIEHAVVCPGSRSTPLAVAFADHGPIHVWSVLDERTAAFFALGIAMATDRPVALLATSGTAGAHFLPAVIEAAMSRVPLVVITADRPSELQGFGAAQTIAQQNLFGSFAREFVDLPAPESAPDRLAHLRAVIARAVAGIRGPAGGALHVNAPFREPLAPSGPWPSHLDRASRPALSISSRSPAPAAEAIAEFSRAVAGSERGIIVCGPRRFDDGFGAAVRQLGASLRYPVLAEAASNARFGPGPEVVAHYDLLLQCPTFADAHRPEVVLRFGGGLTSKRLQTWLDGSHPRTVLFSEGGTLFDPSHLATTVVEGDACLACASLAPNRAPRSSSWSSSILDAERRARAELEATFGADLRLTEPRISREVVAALPEGAALFVSSSMPIREVDAYAGSARAVRVFANRGANGIDGIISSALGVSAGARRPTVLLTGDLALLHDLGALLIAHRHRIPLTVVVVNNDGGGIFSFLPVASATPHFEELFGTPHGLQFEHAARLFGARHAQPQSVVALRTELAASLEGGLHLIEVVVPRNLNPEVHRQISDRMLAAIQREAAP